MSITEIVAVIAIMIILSTSALGITDRTNEVTRHNTITTYNEYSERARLHSLTNIGDFTVDIEDSFITIRASNGTLLEHKRINRMNFQKYTEMGSITYNNGRVVP